MTLTLEELIALSPEGSPLPSCNKQDPCGCRQERDRRDTRTTDAGRLRRPVQGYCHGCGEYTTVNGAEHGRVCAECLAAGWPDHRRRERMRCSVCRRAASVIDVETQACQPCLHAAVTRREMLRALAGMAVTPPLGQPAAL